VRFFGGGMTDGTKGTIGTRSTINKDELEDLYKTALETPYKTRRTKPKSSNSNPIYSSTPGIASGSSSPQINFSVDNSLTEIDFTENTLIAESPKPDSNGSVDGEIENSKSTVLGQINKVEISTSSGGPKKPDMTNTNPFATLKYAVDAVPFFDGNNIPLNYFIEGCEEAKSMLPREAEKQFAKVIRTRIVGEARRTIQDQDFNTVAELTKYLKQIYGATKNVYQLQGELGCIYQRNEEDVITYANRVKFLGKQILEAYKSAGHALEDGNIKTTVENDMCTCFIRGLKPEIEQRIERELDVQETVADALRIERELREMTGLRQGRVVNTGPVVTQEQTCQICFKGGHAANNCRKLIQYSLQGHDFQTNYGTEILICQICKKRGHSADKCRLRDPRARQSINVVQGKIITCQLCSKSGHDAKSCQQNFKQKDIKPTVICQWCDKTGHSANNCWKKQNEEKNSENKPKVTCQLCDNLGHSAKDCRVKLNQQSSPNNDTFCRYCKGQGHLLENCQLRIASNNRRKENNQGNYAGPSGSGTQRGTGQSSHQTASQETK